MSLLRLLARVVRSFSVLNRVVCWSCFCRVWWNHNHGDVSPVRYETLEARQLFSNYVVDTTVDVIDAEDGMTSLREAIIAANDNAGLDVIDFDSDVFAGGETITLGGTELEITDDLMVNGLDGLVIDADQQSRVFHIHGEIDVEMSRMTITGGNVLGHGGGIYVHSGAALTLTEAGVQRNHVHDGRVYLFQPIVVGAYSSNASLVNSNAHDIEAFGGGIAVFDGALILDRVEIDGNTAEAYEKGGGIYAEQSEVQIVNATIHGNGGYYGSSGGLYVVSSDLKVVSSTISGNQGVGIGIFESDAILHHVTVSGNSGGRGWWVWEWHTGQGAGLKIEGSEVELRHLTVTGNSAGGGSGLYIQDSDVVMHNSLVVGNFNYLQIMPNPPRNSGDIHGNLSSESSYNIISSPYTNGGLIDGVNHNVVGVNGRFSFEADTILDPELKDNGGPTKTHALVPGSLAIDAGSHEEVALDILDLDGDGDMDELVAIDQNGGARFINRIDIGATESEHTSVGVLSPISLLRSIQSGAAFKGAVRVRMPNRGDLKMNGPVSLRLVAKSLAGGEDLLLAQKAVRGQAVIGGVLRFYLPDGLSPGDYQLIAEAEGQDVDGRRVVLQAREDNRGEKLNVVAHDMAFLDWKGSLALVDVDDAQIGREQLNRKLKSRASLRMQRRYDGHLPERLQNKLGHRVPLYLKLENVGTLAAGRGSVSYRVLLVNDVEGVKSRKVASGKINVSNMKAGASFSKLIYARLPSDLQNGDYQFSLRLMPDEQFEESNPDGSSVTNNRIDLQQYITVGDPVYIKTRLVQGFTRGREVAGPIRDVIQFNVSNQGDGILKDEVFDMFVTVRRDNRVVATQLIENHVIPELSPGAAVASEVQLNVTGLPVGRYYFEFELRPRDFHSNRYVEDRTFTAYLSC